VTGIDSTSWDLLVPDGEVIAGINPGGNVGPLELSPDLLYVSTFGREIRWVSNTWSD